jgi:hypothetical protein
MKIKQALPPLPITIIYYCAKFLMCFLLFFFLIWNLPLEEEAEPKEKTNQKYAQFLGRWGCSRLLAVGQL